MKLIKNPAAAITYGKRYSARSISAISILAIVLGAMGFPIAKGGTSNPSTAKNRTQFQAAPKLNPQQEMPALKGGAAVEYLKKESTLESLEEAISAAGDNNPGNNPAEQMVRLVGKNGEREFGGSVAISGDTAVVGSEFEDDEDGSVAYIFVRSGNTWTEQQRLRPSDGAEYNRFGASVAISDGTVIIGAPGRDDSLRTDPGAAYIFQRSGTTWTQQQKLVPSSARANSFFGGAVAISGDTAVVGAIHADINATYAPQGAAYVFMRSGSSWTERQKLTGNETYNNHFAFSVAILGNTMIVGVPEDKLGTNGSRGSAFIFARNGSSWSQQQKLTASDPVLGGQFGSSAAISGNSLVIGSPNSGAGAAYIFIWNGSSWTQQQKLTASDGASGDRFGFSVAIFGETAIIGSAMDDIALDNQGSAYSFQRSGTNWTQHEKLVASDGEYYGRFGTSVSISSGTVLIATLGAGVYAINRITEPILSIEIPKSSYDIDEYFEATVKITSDRPEALTFVFDDPLLRERPFSGVSEDGIMTIEETPLPQPFVLSPADPSRSFTIPVQMTKSGVTQIVSSLSYGSAGGLTNRLETVKKVSTPAFEVKVEITPKMTVLDLTKAAKKTERCREIEAIFFAIGIKNCIEITAKVKNLLNRTITNVNIPNADDPLALINETNPKILGEPLTLIEKSVPPSPVTLEPGQEATWTWRMNAFDAPAFLEFEPTVFGVESGREVGGHGNKEFKILEKVLLKWGMKPANGTSMQSGTTVRTEGYLENVSGKDCEEGKECPQGKKLRVMVHSRTARNAGGGFVVPSTHTGPADTYHVFNLPFKGDEKKVSIRALFNSLKTQWASGAEIYFVVKMWIVEDDGKLTFADDQAELDDDDYTDEMLIHYSPNAIEEVQLSPECLKTYRPGVCHFFNGLANDFYPGMVGLWEFGMRGLQAGAERKASISMIEASTHSATLQSILGNEEARDRHIKDLYAEYLRLHEQQVLFEQVAGQIPMTLQQFTFQTLDSFGHFMMAVEEGDMLEIEERIGKFLGSNPDLLLEPFVLMRSFLKLQKALGEMAEGTADNYISAVEKAEKKAMDASLDERIAEAKAKPGDPDLAKALLPGDTLTAKLLIEIFGVDQDTVARIQKIANEAGVVLAFRARSARASELLKMNLAWPKPQALKQKCVNKLDMIYMGYPADSFGKIHIVEPPSNLRGKTGKELKDALDEHMMKLSNKDGFGDLKTNEELFNEVRERIGIRVKEWNDYTPKLELNNPDAAFVRADVNFEGSFQWVRDMSGDIGGKESRKIYRNDKGRIKDPATGEEIRQWEIKMDGPNGQGPRWVTGDIDFLGILDLNGNFVNDTAKRIAIYKAMVEAQLMEHGESMSARLNKAREEYLACCVLGTGEGMLTVGPWAGGPRVGFFVDNRSVMKEKNAAFKQVRGTDGVKRDKAGKIEYDADGRPIMIETRMEDPSGEYLLVNGMPTMRHVYEALVRRFAPTLWETVWRHYFENKVKMFFPDYIKDYLEEQNSFSSPGTVTTSVYSRGGPVVSFEPVSAIELKAPDKLQMWTNSSGWKPATREEVISAGQPGVIDFAPYSVLRENSAAGSNSLAIAPLAEMEATGDFFMAGDSVVLNPGGANQETVVILSMDPVTLTAPLQSDHAVGEMMAWVEAPLASSVKISGRVMGGGRGLGNAGVTITAADGFSRTVTTNALGFYSFSEIPSGKAYTVSVRSKRFRFVQKDVTASSELANVDFNGIE